MRPGVWRIRAGTVKISSMIEHMLDSRMVDQILNPKRDFCRESFELLFGHKDFRQGEVWDNGLN